MIYFLKNVSFIYNDTVHIVYILLVCFIKHFKEVSVSNAITTYNKIFS